MWSVFLERSMAAPLTILGLPLDLQLLILDCLTWGDYVAFALAGYHDLQYRHADRFPHVTRLRLRLIRTMPIAGTDPLMQLPNEMIENIAKYISRRTLMNWVFAHYPTLTARQLVPALTAQNMSQLHLAWLRLGQGN
jgi:hypothetical protein